MVNVLRVVSLSLLCLTVFAASAAAECWPDTYDPRDKK